MSDEHDYQTLLHEYRTLLLEAEKKAQEDFDKTVLTLSGGALGISFAFVKDIVGDKPIITVNLLLSAWITWGASLLFVLASFYLSTQAFRIAITQLDSGDIYKQLPGGFYSRLTAISNITGGILFLVGVVFIVIFAGNNLR